MDNVLVTVYTGEYITPLIKWHQGKKIKEGPDSTQSTISFSCPRKADKFIEEVENRMLGRAWKLSAVF